MPNRRRGTGNREPGATGDGPRAGVLNGPLHESDNVGSRLPARGCPLWLLYTRPMAQRATSTVDWERSRYDGVRMSEAEYLALPEEKPYLEYVDGVVVQKAMGDWDHGTLAHELDFLLGLYRRLHGGHALVELRSLQLPRRNYRLADVSYFAPGAHTGNEALPTLAIEIRSPDETIASQRRKCEGWIEAGCREAWLVEPRSRTVEVFGADGGRRTLHRDETLVSNGAPGLEVDLAALFATLDR